MATSAVLPVDIHWTQAAQDADLRAQLLAQPDALAPDDRRILAAMARADQDPSPPFSPTHQTLRFEPMAVAAQLGRSDIVAALRLWGAPLEGRLPDHIPWTWNRLAPWIRTNPLSTSDFMKEDATVSIADIATRFNHTPLLRNLIAQRLPYPFTRALVVAAMDGHIDCLNLLATTVHDDPPLVKHPLFLALCASAFYGHLPCVAQLCDLLVQRQLQSDCQNMVAHARYAIQQQQLDCFQHIWNRDMCHRANAVLACIELHSLDGLAWLRERRCLSLPTIARTLTVAATHGHLDLLEQTLADHPTFDLVASGTLLQIARGAAEGGHIHVLEYLCRQSPVAAAVGTLKHAAAHGQRDFLNYALAIPNRPSCPLVEVANHALVHASRRGARHHDASPNVRAAQFEILDDLMLHHECVPSTTTEWIDWSRTAFCQYILQPGHEHRLNRFLELGGEWIPELPMAAIQFDREDVLRRALGNGCPRDPQLLAHAIRFGRRRLLDVLFEHHIRAHLSYHHVPKQLFLPSIADAHIDESSVIACLEAALPIFERRGDAIIVPNMWLFEWTLLAIEEDWRQVLAFCLQHLPVHSFPAALPITSGQYIQHAAQHGRLECLRYLREQPCDWDHRALLTAVEANQLECLHYLHTHGCPFDRILHGPALGDAAVKGQLLAVADYLQTHMHLPASISPTVRGDGLAHDGMDLMDLDLNLIPLPANTAGRADAAEAQSSP